MKQKEYLLSEIQKEAYEKGLEGKVKLDKVWEEHEKEYPRSFTTKEELIKRFGEDYLEERDTRVKGMLACMHYEDRIFKKDIQSNLINDGGYEPFKELARAYILSRKEQAIHNAKTDYIENISLIETGKFPEYQKKKIKEE